MGTNLAPLLRWAPPVKPMTNVARATEPVQAARPAEAAQALQVLIADDDEDYRESLESAVRLLGYSCQVARDGAEAWDIFEANGADVILSDWKMPRMDGLHLCQKVRGEESDGAYTHFIFVTGNSDKAHFIDGMHAGADDYIAKPVDLDELEARLAAARRVVNLHRVLQQRNTTLRRDRERARIAARTDPLTDAFNRLALEEDLEALAARVSRYGHRYCAALCDVDEFKSYNDHYGHLPGDEVLRQVARTIHEGLRRGDVFYRYGGEEFLVILPEQSLAEAARGMERVRRAVELLAIPHAPRATHPFVTISAGIAALDPAREESIDAWLRRTDAALYAAKARGRNAVEIEPSANNDGPR
jgi:two-component system cell cycle response regulator